MIREFKVVKPDRFIITGVYLTNHYASNLPVNAGSVHEIYGQCCFLRPINATGFFLFTARNGWEDTVVIIYPQERDVGISIAEHFTQFRAGVCGVLRGFWPGDRGGKYHSTLFIKGEKVRAGVTCNQLFFFYLICFFGVIRIRRYGQTYLRLSVRLRMSGKKLLRLKQSQSRFLASQLISYEGRVGSSL